MCIRDSINTVEDLISKTQDEMIKVRNLGRKSLEEVEHKLAMMGLSLALSLIHISPAGRSRRATS